MRYALQRFLQFLLVFFLVTFFVLVATRIGLKRPGAIAAGRHGDPAADRQVITASTTSTATTRPVLLLAEEPAHRQHGPLEVFSTDVSTLITQKIVPTLLLGVYALTLALIIAVPLGVCPPTAATACSTRAPASSRSPSSRPRRSCSGVLFSLLFVNHFGCFPRDRRQGLPVGQPGRALQELLPADVMLALPLAAVLTRLLRADMVADPAERLHHAGPGQGHVAEARPVAPRPARFAVLAADQRRPAARRAARRRRRRRADLRTEGHGQAADRGRSSPTTCSSSRRSPRSSCRGRRRQLRVDLLYAVVDPRIRHARALG